MARVVFLTNMERQFTMMEQARKQLEAERKLQTGSQVVFLNGNSIWEPEHAAVLENSDIVLFSWMGVSYDIRFLKQTMKFLRKKGIRHVMLAAAANPEDSLQGVSLEEQVMMRTYLLYSGRENYRNFWLWLAAEFCGEDCEYQPPQQLLWNGIFHPRAGEPIVNIAQYQEQFIKPDRPTIGILFSRDEWVWGDLAYQTALAEEIERQGMNVIAAFSHWARNAEQKISGVDDTVKAYFYQDGMQLIDVLINTFKFSLTVGRPVDQKFLRQLDVPILQAYGLLRPCAEWENSSEGMTPTEISHTISMPEFDGVIHAVPVASKENFPDGTKRYMPIRERLGLVVRKAGKWARLRCKANSEKKIAIIFHNYPATNSNIGSAQGMDSPASIRLLLERMAGRGYKVDHIPADSQAFMNDLLAAATNDRRYLTEQQIEQAAGKVSDAQYREWVDNIAPENREQLTRDWGEPPGDVFHYDGQLLVPGRLNGNIFITVQPPRGFGEDPGKILHSPDCAPTHHYLAYYHWIRDVWQADAVVHVGTHGSLEWLPGKGAGLSCRCYPDLSIGDLPNVYPYLITIVGEGLQAKRRGAACLIGHLPPPMSHADTYEEMAELEKLLDEYVHFKVNQPGNLDVVMEQIRGKAAALNLTEDIPEQADQSFDDYVQRLHVYITDIKNMTIRVGLHVLGCPPEGEVLEEYLLALTRMDNGDVPSMPKALAAAYGCDYYQLLEQSGTLLPDGSKTGGALLDEIRGQCREIIGLLAENNFAVEQAGRILDLPWIKQFTPQIAEQLLQTGRYICQTVVPNLQKTEQEITNLLAALGSRYVEPSPAGAITGGMADILPTGRNFYGIDPRTLPSPSAWEIGKTLGDNVIGRYIEEEGGYPENIGMVVWCGANMRSHGQCIAEFLYLLGIRPVWQRGSLRVVNLEVIPLAELKRPRIDVTARISGLVRDALPTAVEWMDKAAIMAAELEESSDSNYVRKHALEDAGELEKQGADKSQAWEQACYRVFGCPPGTYGAGVGHMLEAKNWETVDDLAQVYVRWGAHAYGSKVSGSFVPALFTRRLSSLDVTIKNEDNREVHMLNSDDFNAYHGGMIAAVRSFRGKAPRSYCGDSSDRQHVELRSLEEEFKRIFRGEVMNPKYIEGMKQHGYKGAADLAGTVAHCYDWDATSEVMENWMYDGLAKKYALDEKMREWLQEVNPWALQRIVEKLLEASQRNMWQADEQTLQELQQLYLSIEGELEERGDGK
ncbi:MAG: cobaltochelatase subunit CobN [Veillonellales bacterium]